MNINLEGKTAVVCGSSQGIGRAIALDLAVAGAKIILIARNKEALSSVCDELSTSAGQKHEVLPIDFSKPDELKKSLKKIQQPVHILVNNSGGPAPGAIFEANPEVFEKAFLQHIVANQILVQALAPGMKSEKYGRIINIISTSVKEPIMGLGVSNTIRAAVANWSKTLSKELGAFGITVNNVLPGFTDTARLKNLFEAKAKRLGKDLAQVYEDTKESVPLKRLAEPQEIAHAVTFLSSIQAAYINGVNLPVDGGRLNCG
jgi:3-oxoacyl-[acyl-carrier protein] reductase